MDKYTEKDLYYVAVKVFLRDGDKLLITHDIFGEWDLPGGRIRTDEFDKPLETVIERKIREELGSEVKYKLGEPIVFMRHERQEATQNNKTVRIFAVGYDAKYLGGEVKLGDHHDKLEWVNIKTFKPDKYFTGGWREGVKEYLKKLK